MDHPRAAATVPTVFVCEPRQNQDWFSPLSRCHLLIKSAFSRKVEDHTTLKSLSLPPLLLFSPSSLSVLLPHSSLLLCAVCMNRGQRPLWALGGAVQELSRSKPGSLPHGCLFLSISTLCRQQQVEMTQHCQSTLTSWKKQVSLLHASRHWPRIQGDGGWGWDPFHWNFGCTDLIESRREVGLACNAGWSMELCHQAWKGSSGKAECMRALSYQRQLG